MKFLKQLFNLIFRRKAGRTRDDIGGGDPLLLSEIAAASLAPRLEALAVEDLMVIQRFLSSVPGKAFLQRMRAIEAHVAIEACKDLVSTSHSAGRAAGFGEARNWIISLSRISVRDITETPGGKPAESDGNEPDKEQPGATGEALLVERFSP